MRTPSANVHTHCAHARVQRLHRHAPLRTQASKSSDEAMQVKRLQQEKDVLQRKVTRLTASIAAGGGGGASSGADEQVDYYRRMVKCTLCQENEKNAVIVKCGYIPAIASWYRLSTCIRYCMLFETHSSLEKTFGVV